MHVGDLQVPHGGYSDIFSAILHSGFLYRNFPDNRFSSLGFRLARDLVTPRHPLSGSHTPRRLNVYLFQWLLV